MTRLYLKMDGHKLYEYALKTVPGVVMAVPGKGRADRPRRPESPDPPGQRQDGRSHPEAGFKLAGLGEAPLEVMPMTISWLGNSSVATLPTLLDLLLKEKLDGHAMPKGAIILSPPSAPA